MSGVNIDVRTIYLSRDYKKDYKNYRAKFLEAWEKRHREFLQNLLKTQGRFEKIIMNRLIPIKVEVNDVKIVITDTVTSNSVKKIALNISHIISYGCNELWDPTLIQEGPIVRRLFKITQMYVNIYKEKYVREDDAEAGIKIG